MKKIPTIFERDWTGDRSRVVDIPHPDCAWVFAGEGVATQKIDGTACMVRTGRLFKRRELKPGQAGPADFETAEHDVETGKTVGWIPVGDGPEDAYHREAFARTEWPRVDLVIPDGTYELIGPKIQGNPEGFGGHWLVPHGRGMAGDVGEEVPRDFDGLHNWLARRDLEGVVFHHPDGRMAKIKKRDFGLKR